MDPRKRSFIEQHTSLQHLPHVPEVRLSLASEMMPLWAAIEEEWGRGNGPPFWAFAWAGGLALARYLLSTPAEITGKRVLDLATGSGLCAIAAAMAGATTVLAADIDPFSEEAVAINAARNGVAIGFVSGDPTRGDPPSVDVILAGDVCYEEPTARRIVAWLRRAQERGVRVLIGDPFRAHLPLEELVQLAEYEVCTTRELEDAEIKRAGVFTFGPMADGHPQ